MTVGHQPLPSVCVNQPALGRKRFQCFACGPIEVIPTPQTIDCDQKSHSENSPNSNFATVSVALNLNNTDYVGGSLPRWMGSEVSS
jgi:hypothetical protein